MDKTYNHLDHESKIYKQWESSGAFKPKINPDGAPYSIIMPPPNANDPLHVGHAMFVSIEDILIRYHRMKGEASLWLPGTDHAGIETQFVFEKKLSKDGKSRFDFDRETLYQKIWDYVQENSGVAVEQMKKLGASADWSRFNFTLDPQVVEIVLSTFQTLHSQKLIYRDQRLVNYCTRCGTGFSELEVKHEVRKDPFIYIKYGPFTIGTVRPETKFRDTALAVNPKDPRYQIHIGKTFEIPGLLGPITMRVITDDEVDPEFGTGIMKVTPAHDFHDFELGKANNLPVTPIIDFKGKMDFSWYLNRPDFASLPTKYQERAKQYHELHVSKARPLMIQHLQEDGLLEKVNTDYEHTVSICYRCGSLLEPLPLPQFFLTVKPLTQKALNALDNGEVVVYGSGHDKILRHWLENLNDWNISRQIVWGIRLPVWYSLKKNPTIQITYIDAQGNRVIRSAEGILATNELDQAKSGLQQLQAPVGSEYVISKTSPGPEFFQETDTFDTWFSSGQWPVVTLQTHPGDFEKFYPTSVMETGYDILPFWVMRMLMLGLYLTDQVPFKKVYLHGLVRDEQGRKMSKSIGNVINPLAMVEKYGADAIRMALVMSSTPGQDKSVGEQTIKGMRNFSNKIWNAARFVQMLQSEEWGPKAKIEDLNETFINELKSVIQEVTDHLDNLRVGLAAEVVYNKFWHWYCDWAIEKAKVGSIKRSNLILGLETFLKLLHPFMPFVTEAIWQELKHLRQNPNQLLITSPWPTETNPA